MQPTTARQSETQQPATIDPAAEVGTVTLKVADLGRSLAFYTQVIGLQSFHREGQYAVLGAGHRRILSLEETRGARYLARNVTGLYHAAILFPDRHALAVKIAQILGVYLGGMPDLKNRHALRNHIAGLIESELQFGYADHLVSEAFYLSDPDGNGLELYRDRPRSEWTWDTARVRMASDPINFDSFFGEVQANDTALANPAAPDGTKLGHMHLRVGDIPTAERFYHGVLGFDVVAKMPGALFVSAGGYHHHIGMNTWESSGAQPPTEPSAGLREFSIVVPDQAELNRLTLQIEGVGVVVEHNFGSESATIHDPWKNRINLILPAQLASA